MKNQKGFSMTEILTCIFIITSLTSISLPSFTQIHDTQVFNSEVIKIVEIMKHARSVAIKNNTIVSFCYTTNGYIAFIDDGSNGGISNDWQRQAGELLIAAVNFGNDFHILVLESHFKDNRTQFTGHTNLKAGSLVLQGKNGRKSRIVMNTVGRIRVERLNG